VCGAGTQPGGIPAGRKPGGKGIPGTHPGGGGGGTAAIYTNRPDNFANN
jgi:hypothetical protein